MSSLPAADLRWRAAVTVYAIAVSLALGYFIAGEGRRQREGEPAEIIARPVQAAV